LSTIAAEWGEVIVAGKRLETMWIPPSRDTRPTIVMLHEGLGSVALWKDLPAKLAERTGSGVLAYSRYGHGSSDMLARKRPVRFMHYEGEIVVPELLEKLGIKKPILLGHSDGGSIALIFAGKFPEAVSGLMLEAPHVFVEDLSIASITQAKTTYESTDFAQKLGRYHANVDATFWGWNDIWLNPAFRSWNIEEYVPRITCPVLCIQGEQDEYGTTAQVEAIKAAAPQTRIEILPDCKHSPHRDQQERTLKLMAEFVEDIAASKQSAAARSIPT
jgi:pimeloyl-ACP methyl ester carboxylesterase